MQDSFLCFIFTDVSCFGEICTKNTVRRHILPNLCFAHKKWPKFGIFSEKVLDNGGRVWYHTSVR